ncbi:MAG: CBS domain-containing protein [Phycisphaerales bacterium]|nr:MAG: CBS domain-containing protein [Phycisphaerales bacterium]
MTVLAADIESRTEELSQSSFEAFCDDIAAMFDADVACTRQEVGTGTVKDVQKHFKKLMAVHHVEATGAMDGTFHLLFDQGGLFTLSGVIVMLPEQRIREEIRSGSLDDAENLTDAAREVGNLLVGSWDRVFREECKGHDHFLKTGTFIGKFWENLAEVDLSVDDELVYVLHEMTVDSYPNFRCAAVFPKTVLTGTSSAEAEEPSEAQPADEPPVAAPEPATAQEPAAAATADSAPAEVAPVEPAAPPKSAPEDIESPWPERTSTEPPKAAAAAPTPNDPPTVAEPLKAATAQIPEDIRSTVEAVIGEGGQAAPQTPHAAQQSGKSEGDYIGRMFDDLVGYSSDTGIAELLKVRAKDIMVPEVVWSQPEDTVQEVVAKMQQHNTGYVLIGQDGVLEGLVSNSNILGAVSPYLRPMFAKWRRPEDDATLEIKIKWVMSRPVRTINPDTTLASMIESMRRYGGRCLPVVDGEAKVQGIVTVFNILLRILEADKSFSWEGEPPEAPPLLI